MIIEDQEKLKQELEELAIQKESPEKALEI